MFAASGLLGGAVIERVFADIGDGSRLWEESRHWVGEMQLMFSVLPSPR